MKKNLTKKIITTLLVIPILIQSVGVSYAATNQIAENTAVITNLTSESRASANGILATYRWLSGAFMSLGSYCASAGLPFQGFIFGASNWIGENGLITPFIVYGNYALGTDYGTADSAFISTVAYSMNFLKNPDKISWKVEYKLYSDKITYEHFKTEKYMYTKNSNTIVYKYANGKNKSAQVNGIGRIRVYGIVNGYADTEVGFIKISDLTSTKPAAPVAVSSVGLNSTSITLKNIRNYKLTATVSPSNASNKTITWTSSNGNVAKVDQNGNVTAVNEGTATITAKSNNGKIATCKVTVINPASVAVSSVGLNSTSITLKNIRNYKLTATVSPSNASNKTITWTSSNSNVARVDVNGNVTAVNAGTATITAKSNNGKTTTCKVTVINPASVAVSSVGLKSSTTIVKGKTEKLTATVSPSNASNKAVTWTSSNSNVARVDANGNVTAVNAGTATITAKSNNGKIATCKVTVNNPYKTRAVKFTVNVPTSFKQKHYVEILDANNNVIYTSAVKTGSSIYNFTYQLDTSSSSYTRKIRIRTASDNKRYDSVSFKINSSTINKNVTATFTSGTTANSLKTGQIVQK